jgi:murein DD-endopeptidase MepM/ murein hydrolase activator NlpD
VLLAAALLLAVPADVVSASRCWLPPVVGKVADPFRSPPCPFCAGNRGIEYRVRDATVVRSVASGSVTFAGLVAGTRYVVVDVGGGWRTTYGRLDSSSLSAGDRVVAGVRIGSASGLVFFGVRVGEHYVDPAPFLGRLVGEPRLVPTDATAPRPTRSTTVRCR